MQPGGVQSSLVEGTRAEVMMMIGLRILIWLIPTLLLSSCMVGSTDASGPAPFPPDRSTTVSRRPATFTESYRWVDGLAVDIVEVNHGRLLASIPVNDPTARAGDPCSEITIVVRNGSDHMVRIVLTARLRYGPDLAQAATYVATAGHADHSTAQYIDPGEVSYPYTLGFVLPAEARNDVVLDLGIDNWTHERAVFAGSIAGRLGAGP
jgi:hypothetical protein